MKYPEPIQRLEHAYRLFGTVILSTWGHGARPNVHVVQIMLKRIKFQILSTDTVR